MKVKKNMKTTSATSLTEQKDEYALIEGAAACSHRTVVHAEVDLFLDLIHHSEGGFRLVERAQKEFSLA